MLKRILKCSLSSLLAVVFFLLGSCTGDSKNNPSNGNLPTEGTYPKLNLEETLLIEAVRNVGGNSVQGQRNTYVCEVAVAHLDYMIQVRDINHDRFSDRTKLIQQHGGSKVGEIVAYNGGQNIEGAAKTCANSWRNSPGHWQIMQVRWDQFCYVMKKALNGHYYCIGLVANGAVK